MYYDVIDLSELPAPPDGFRYFDFIGGTKELRCYLAPKEMPRSEFLQKWESELDPCLQPIYKNQKICVKQDASFALPGFYIVSPLDHYHCLDDMPEELVLRLSFIIYTIRKGMRHVLGIDRVHIYYEEKPSPSATVHYWIMPIHNQETVDTSVTMQTRSSLVYDLKVGEYLGQFCYSQNKETILQYNAKMRAYIAHEGLLEKDNAFIPK